MNGKMITTGVSLIITVFLCIYQLSYSVSWTTLFIDLGYIFIFISILIYIYKVEFVLSGFFPKLSATCFAIAAFFFILQYSNDSQKYTELSSSFLNIMSFPESNTNNNISKAVVYCELAQNYEGVNSIENVQKFTDDNASVVISSILDDIKRKNEQPNKDYFRSKCKESYIKYNVKYHFFFKNFDKKYPDFIKK